MKRILNGVLLFTVAALALGAVPARVTPREVACDCPSDPNQIPAIIDWIASPGNCGPPTQVGNAYEFMHYKVNCLTEAGAGTPLLSRANQSAAQCAAFAIRAAMKAFEASSEAERNLGKYEAIAWLALAEGHDCCARKTLNDHKKIAFEYLVTNYVVAWRDDDPDNYHGRKEGQPFKVDNAYNITELDCDLNDEMSIVQLPPGLGAIVCDHHSGNPSAGRGCLELASGTQGVGENLNDQISYIRVFRR